MSSLILYLFSVLNVIPLTSVNTYLYYGKYSVPISGPYSMMKLNKVTRGGRRRHKVMSQEGVKPLLIILFKPAATRHLSRVTAVFGGEEYLWYGGTGGRGNPFLLGTNVVRNHCLVEIRGIL